MAKFKVGDKVKYHGRRAVVTEVHHDGESDYLLDVEGAGSGWYADEDEVTAADAARNAKYAVGDHVKFNVIHGFTPVPKTGKIRSVSKIGPNGDVSVEEWYYIDVDGGGKAAIQDDFIVGKNACAKNAVVRNALMNATVDVSKIEADVNAWIAAIRQAAKAKRQAHEIGKRIKKVAGRREILDNPGLESVLKKANSVYDDASYVKTSQSDFETVFAY